MDTAGWWIRYLDRHLVSHSVSCPLSTLLSQSPTIIPEEFFVHARFLRTRKSPGWMTGEDSLTRFTGASIVLAPVVARLSLLPT